MNSRHSASRGMNSTPIAYSPGFGSSMPSSAHLRAKNLCGICIRMPAPSPARGSAPTAPRCSRLSRMVKRVFDDLVRLAALDVGDESDAAGILVERRIVEAARRGHAGIGGIGKAQARVDERCRRKRCVRAYPMPVPLFLILQSLSRPRSPPRGRRTCLVHSADYAPRLVANHVKGSLLAGRSPPAPRAAAHVERRSKHTQVLRRAATQTAAQARITDWDSNTVL